MKRIFVFSWSLYAVIFAFTLQAQPAEQFVKVIVAPDQADWTYKTGEKVKFTISVLHNGNPVKDAKIRYEVSPEKMEPVIKESTVLSKGTLTVDAGTLKTPGFLRCIAFAEVDGKEYKG